MKKSNLLLFDANVVIELFRQGILDKVIESYDVHLSKTVTDEAHFYETPEGERHDFDLTHPIHDARGRCGATRCSARRYGKKWAFWKMTECFSRICGLQLSLT